ncbi:serine protease [Hellea sp.]|nr:serine protease [Hellea sp.]
MKKSNADKLVRSTVKIDIVISGQTVGSGSGLFMMLHPYGDEQFAPVVVTNRHVVEKGDEFLLRYKRTDGAIVTSTTPQSAIVFHPEKDIDLAIIPVSLETVKQEFGALVSFISDKDILRAGELKNLTAIEDIYMIGYPNGLIDKSNFYPIVRKGVTATPVFENYSDTPTFLVDCACFPGSSGSPVFIFDKIGFMDKHNDMHLGKLRFGLLGFLFAGPVFTATGEIKSEIPPENLSDIVKTPLMMNLGNVVKAEKVLDFYSQIVAEVEKPINNS